MKSIESKVFCLTSVEMKEHGFNCFLYFVIRGTRSVETGNTFFQVTATNYRLQKRILSLPCIAQVVPHQLNACARMMLVFMPLCRICNVVKEYIILFPFLNLVLKKIIGTSCGIRAVRNTIRRCLG